MRLTVKPLKNRDPGSGMAVIDREALGELGLSGGDFVRIEGRGGTATVARVWPSDANDADRGIVRIDGQMRQAADVDLDDLAARTEGFVGADVEAVCREAAATAVREYVEAGADPDAVDEITLTMDHFEQALDKVGAKSEDDGGAVAPMADGAG